MVETVFILHQRITEALRICRFASILFNLTLYFYANIYSKD